MTDEHQPAPMPEMNATNPDAHEGLEERLGDVPLEITVELGRITMPLSEVIDRLGPGSVVPLSKLTGEQLDVLVNGRLIARGEAVAVGDRYGIRIVSLEGGREAA